MSLSARKVATRLMAAAALVLASLLALPAAGPGVAAQATGTALIAVQSGQPASLPADGKSHTVLLVTLDSGEEGGAGYQVQVTCSDGSAAPDRAQDVRFPLEMIYTAGTNVGDALITVEVYYYPPGVIIIGGLEPGNETSSKKWTGEVTIELTKPAGAVAPPAAEEPKPATELSAGLGCEPALPVSGDQVVCTARVEGATEGEPLGYHWFLDGKQMDVTDQPTYVWESAQPGPHRIAVLVIGDNRTTDAEFPLHVGEELQVKVALDCQPEAPEVGAPVACIATVSGARDDEQLVFEWALDGQPVPGASRPDWTWPAATAGPHRISVIVVGDNSSDGAERSIVVASTELLAAIGCAPDSPREGDSMMCSAVVLGAAQGEELKYSWYLDGLPQMITTTPSWTWPSATIGPHTVSVLVEGEQRQAVSEQGVNVQAAAVPAPQPRAPESSSALPPGSSTTNQPSGEAMRNLESALAGGNARAPTPGQAGVAGAAAAAIVLAWLLNAMRAGGSAEIARQAFQGSGLPPVSPEAMAALPSDLLGQFAAAGVTDKMGAPYRDMWRKLTEGRFREAYQRWLQNIPNPAAGSGKQVADKGTFYPTADALNKVTIQMIRAQGAPEAYAREVAKKLTADSRQGERITQVMVEAFRTFRAIAAGTGAAEQAGLAAAPSAAAIDKYAPDPINFVETVVLTQKSQYSDAVAQWRVQQTLGRSASTFGRDPTTVQQVNELISSAQSELAARQRALGSRVEAIRSDGIAQGLEHEIAALRELKEQVADMKVIEAYQRTIRSRARR